MFVWIFMLLFDLMTPILMIGFGYLFYKKPPTDINSVYGYRTSMSMKNKDTWEFAHKYFGKLWIVWGKILLGVSILIMCVVFGQSDDIVGVTGGIYCIIQCIILLIPIVPTERALKRTFDRYGERR